MDIKTFFKSIPRDQREAFAQRCETTIGHLSNVAGGKTCGEKLAINIERESSGAVRCEDLRPDVDWAYLRATPSVPTYDTPAPTSEPIHECASGDPRVRPDRRSHEEKRQCFERRKEGA